MQALCPASPGRLTDAEELAPLYRGHVVSIQRVALIGAGLANKAATGTAVEASFTMVSLLRHFVDLIIIIESTQHLRHCT
jgi:hypothetical protein